MNENTQNAYVKKLANALLDVWLEGDNGDKLFRYTGGYWEVLLPILRKYAPEKLKKYENMIGEEFDYSNEKVKNLLDTGDEEQNIKNAVNYMNYRIDSYYTPSEIHYIEDENGEDIPYMPNQAIDINQHYGRDYD